MRSTKSDSFQYRYRLPPNFHTPLTQSFSSTALLLSLQCKIPGQADISFQRFKRLLKTFLFRCWDRGALWLLKLHLISFLTYWQSCVCISDHKEENLLQWMLAAYTHATVGDFIMSNWTDIHVVDPGIKVNRECYPYTPCHTNCC